MEDYLKRLDEGDVEDGATSGGARTKNLAEKIAALRQKRGRYEAMLAKLERTGEDQISLQAALAWSLMQTRGSVEKSRNAWTAMLKHADNLGNVDYQLRALWGLWTGLLNNAQLREALAIAERFCAIATKSADSSDSFVGDRMVGYILHLLGDQIGARLRIERMLDQYVAPVTAPRIMRFVFDQRVAARCFLARILWLQGFPDQAVSAVESALAEAKASNDTDGLGKAGQSDQGLVAIDEALAGSRRNDENWYVAELLRIKGELLLQTGRTIAVSDAEKRFQ